MIRSLRIAASGMDAQELRVDMIANIANVSTTGFKRGRAEFSDMLYAELGGPKGSTEAQVGELAVGQGVRPSGGLRIMGQGPLQRTGEPLDLAVEGQGFLVVREGDKIMYTRDGSLKVDSEGRVVNSSGALLDPPITIPAGTTEINVTRDGTVTAKVAGSDQPVDVGRIELAVFANPSGLEPLGRNMYAAGAASGAPIMAAPTTDSAGAIAQGFLEGSNVSIVQEMVDLIAAQRAYETNSRVIRAADEMLHATTQLK